MRKFKVLKAKLREKRGAALMSALAFMFMILVLGIILTSAVSYAHLQVNTNQTVENAWLRKEEIGEYFVKNVSEDTDESFQNERLKNSPYTAETKYETGKKSLNLRNGQGKTVLYIEAEETSGAWQVTRWQYSKIEP